MAKLTARFDLQDRISRKLRMIRGEINELERARSRMERPLLLQVKDQATVVLKRVQSFMLRRLVRTHTFVVGVKDQAMRPLRALSNYVERKMPRTHSVVVRAKDEALSMMKEIAGFGKSVLSKGYRVTVWAVDKTRGTLSSISRSVSSLTEKSYNMTVRTIDFSTRTIGTVKRALFSLPSLVTVTLAVVGAGQLKDVTLGAAMNFEEYEVAMDHWLKGNKKKSKALIDWMGRFADKTPFSSPDLFPALTRGIGVTEGNVKEAKKLLKIATDMAALTPGKTVGDAMEALSDAQMGEFARMTEFNVKMSKKAYEAMGGWPEFIKEVDKKFDDGAQKISQTARGKLSTLQGYIGASFRSMGQGALEALKPRLDAINLWIDNNQDKWQEWKKTLKSISGQSAEWLFGNLEKGFLHIKTNYLENKEFKKLDFEGKIKFITEDIGIWWSSKGKPALDSWWESQGKPWAEKAGIFLGEALFNGIVAGMKARSAFLKDAWKEAIADPSVQSLGGATIGTALTAAVGGALLYPITKGLAGIGKQIGGVIKVGKQTTGKVKGAAGKAKEFVDKKKQKPSTPSSYSEAMKQRKGASATGKSSKLFGGAGNALGALGTLMTFKTVDDIGTGLGDWLFGHKAGQEKFNGLLSNPFGKKDVYKEDRQGAISKFFTGTKASAATLDKPTKSAASTEKSNEGFAQGQAFGKNFMAGLNSAPINVTSWLNEKVYKPVGSAATNSKNLGYAFSAGFVQGLNSAPVSVYTWINEKIYKPFGSAATNSKHLGYAFSYGFVTGLGSAPVDVYSWINQNIYIPVGSAVKSAQHFGYAFSYGFVSGMKNSPLTVSSWVTTNIYQPLNQAALGAKLYGSALVYNFKNGIKAVPVGMSTWLNNHVGQPFLKYIPSGKGFGQGLAGYFIAGMKSKKADVSAEAKALAKAVESAFRKELGIHSPSRVMADLGYWSAMGVVKGFSSVDVSNIAKNKANELMGSFGNFSGGGAAMAQSAIMQALQITGMPMSWLNPLMWVAQKESGFNPNAINNWDINAKRGDPSVGLFQIIGETFKRWALPGFNDRRNPLHSAIAAIRYINGRYGGIQNHPGVKSRARGGGYKPYAKGGIITHDHIARVGEGGKREVIIPLEQHRNRALGLLEYAQKALGVSSQPAPVVLPEEQTQAVRNVMSRPAQMMKQGVRDVIVQIIGESHYHNEMDAEKVGRIAVKAVEEHLEEEYFAGGEMAVYD
ncbi:transglycosylase SLT domain-containing protein [Bacillus badius]|uniref:Phage tail length tape-measure protein n=1 Tax=Bacillus badius TaxID=1455 RepID=A0ABR5B164_BACBA|nr:transglycosylase SLT domain-containing protein [Bacillus badius]KIL80735.1 Phage tail length tape-measure protein [Bacillus badius]MED4715336.1 transglycosylase SLT domain-containing protein [Bacillus badius]